MASLPLIVKAINDNGRVDGQNGNLKLTSRDTLLTSSFSFSSCFHRNNSPSLRVLPKVILSRPGRSRSGQTSVPASCLRQNNHALQMHYARADVKHIPGFVFSVGGQCADWLIFTAECWYSTSLRVSFIRSRILQVCRSSCLTRSSARKHVCRNTQARSVLQLTKAGVGPIRA